MSNEITNWLRSLGLEQYASVFEDNAIDAGVLPELTADDLKDLGVSLVGHRRKLLAAIAALRDEASPAETRSASTPSLPLIANDPGPKKTTSAERRQLTVMFCDLVGSTALSARLDPEDMREVIATYQGCCAEVIGRFEGYVAKFMGDGVLAYFGWPTAHEDDAERAIRAGLDLTAAVAALKPKSDLELAVRIGISTGEVVVGDLVGAGAAQEQAVVGETPNLAARIQSLAEPGTIAVGPSTRKLVGAAFEYQDLGSRVLAGVSEPVQVWRVLQPSLKASRFDAMRGTVLVPLIGREEEVEILIRRWDLAKRGEGQIVLLSGEPGIGKSRLVRVLHERVADAPHTPLLYQCSSLHIHSAFHPITEQIERVAGFTAQDRPERKLERLRALLELAPDDLAVFAALLSLPGGERFPEVEPDPERRKFRILAAFLRQLEGLAAQRPLTCVFEDVHWIDPSTMDFLAMLVEWIPSRPVLLLVTCRPEFVSPWTGLAHSTLMALSRMSVSGTRQLIAGAAGGKRLPAEVVEQIVLKTDGIPLFVEELTRTVIESGVLESTDDAYFLAGALPMLAIPATLHDSLMARLDRLPGVREVAQLGAAIGRSFDYRLLLAVSGRGDEILTGALTQLEQAGLLVRRGNPPESSYSFKHALIQEAAYRSLLRATRRDYHRRIAAALEQQSADLAKTDAELLAHHYAEGDLPEPAIRYLRKAGESAIESSAYAEAISNLAKGLELLAHLPDSPQRAHEEIAVALALGGAQVQRLGPTSAEVERTYLRAHELCEHSGTPQQRFTALWGLWFVSYMRGNLYRARERGDQLLPLAEELGDQSLLLEAHHVRWAGLSLVGDLRIALAHTEDGIARYNREEHHRLTFVYGGHDPGLCARNLNAVLLCLLGHPEQAQRRCQTALALAHELGHPYTLLEGLFNALLVGLVVNDVAAVEEQTLILDELVRGGKLPREASGVRDGFHGWALTERGAVERGLDLMRKACADWQSFFGAWCFPLDASMAAVLGKAACADEGLRLVDQTLAAAEQGGAHWWDAELYRVRAHLRLAASPGRRVDVEADLKKAVAAARAQEARFFELRAATSLARLLAEQGKRRQAHDLLAPIYGWFTEGFATADLKEAKALLDELA